MQNNIKILIVDDEQLILLAWQHQLGSEGYDVRVALNGKEAIAAAMEEKPHIVITDLIMPGMNGVEVCKRIKEMYPDTEVVIVSGNPLETERQLMDFLNAGGRDEYLRKPLLDDELVNSVRKIVAERG